MMVIVIIISYYYYCCCLSFFQIVQCHGHNILFDESCSTIGRMHNIGTKEVVSLSHVMFSKRWRNEKGSGLGLDPSKVFKVQGKIKAQMGLKA